MKARGFAMIVFVFTLMTALSAFSSDGFINKYPAKIQKCITLFQNHPLVDDYKWMENSADHDLYIWRKNQNKQTREFVNPESMAFYIEAQQRFDDFQKKLQKKSLKEEKQEKKIVQNSNSGIQDESSLYQLKIEDVLETGMYSGALKRINIINRKNSQTVQSVLGNYTEILGWLDDNQYIYSHYRSKKIDQGNTPYIGVHKIEDDPIDDKILVDGEPGDFFYTYKNEGKLYLQYFKGQTRYFDINLLNPHTGELEQKISFGTETQPVGTGVEAGEYFHYHVDYAKKNYGAVTKYHIDTGKAQVLFEPKDFIVTSLKYIGENKYFFEGQRDGEGFVGFFEEGNINIIEGLENGNVWLKNIDEEKLELTWQSYGAIKQFEYHLGTKELKLVQYTPYPIEIESQKIHYTTPKGEKAFIWVTKRADVELTPETPLIAYGYGGWYHNEVPMFNHKNSLGWVERGGAFAVAAVPGSLAYGMSWNKMAKAHNRIVSFDYFAEAIKELIKRGYTSSEKVGILGNSNGGLLVAGTLMRHPKLIKAAVPRVGVYNLLDCNEKGLFWELGNPCNKSVFKKLIKISPLHNITQKDYPAVLVMTSEQDNITNPYDSYKLAANLQRYNTSGEPILLYTKKGGGHLDNAGSKRQVQDYIAITYAFFEKVLGLVKAQD